MMTTITAIAFLVLAEPSGYWDVQSAATPPISQRPVYVIPADLYLRDQVRSATTTQALETQLGLCWRDGVERSREREAMTEENQVLRMAALWTGVGAAVLLVTSLALVLGG